MQIPRPSLLGVAALGEGHAGLQELPRVRTWRSWEETPDAFAARLRSCCADMKASCDADGPCRAFLDRARKLQEAKGGKLKE